MNTVNWMLWLLLAMVYAMLTYNPLYHVLLFACLFAVAASKRLPAFGYVKAGLLVSAIPLFVNVFLVHRGDTVLYRIPRTVSFLGLDAPVIAFGGAVTAESVVAGATMSLFLVNMITAFQVFNANTSPDAILRILPSSIPSLSLAASIALRYVPTVLKDHERITDAQRARGVRITQGPLKSRLKNNLSTLAPTIITSLERAFNLSEAMACRGYAGKRTRYHSDSWTTGEYVRSASSGAVVVALAYAAHHGLMSYWPYDSLMPSGPHALLFLSLVVLFSAVRS